MLDQVQGHLQLAILVASGCPTPGGPRLPDADDHLTSPVADPGRLMVANG
jgi:hypothetical protein